MVSDLSCPGGSLRSLADGNDMQELPCAGLDLPRYPGEPRQVRLCQFQAHLANATNQPRVEFSRREVDYTAVAVLSGFCKGARNPFPSHPLHLQPCLERGKTHHTELFLGSCSA